MTLLAPPPASASIDPDEIAKMDGLFELVDDQLVEKQMSFLSGATCVNLSFALQAHIRANKLGTLASEVTFRCFPNKPRQVRRPDLAFVAAARLAKVPDEGNVPVPPDLAIEVVSPGDTILELDDKLIDYRAAAIPIVWVINPHARYVRIFRPGQRIEELGDADQLTGDAVLPGFSTPVTDLFPPLQAPAETVDHQ